MKIDRLRAMALLRWLLLAASASAALYTFLYFGFEGASTSQGEARFYCPMHPEIRSANPGDCPICHMRLEPIPEERRTLRGEGGAEGMPEGLVPVQLALERQQSLGLVLAKVEKRRLQPTLRLPASVEAREGATAEVRVRSPAFIEALKVRESGVSVKAGQVLASIFSPDLYRVQEEMLAARGWGGVDAGLGKAQSAPLELASAARRSLELYGVSAADIDAVLARGEPLRALPLRSPVSGIVTRFNASLGTYATPEMVLYEITDLSRVWVVASVQERELARVHQGMTGQFDPGEGTPPLAVRVDLLEPSLDASTRSLRLRMVVSNPKQNLRPGRYGEVTLTLPESESLVVPREAIVDTGRERYVYVSLGEGRFAPRALTLGAESESWVQVRAGLREGDEVVSRGGFLLDSESRLQAALVRRKAASPDAAVAPKGGAHSSHAGGAP